MANVPYTGVPSVEPSAAPTPTPNISAPPEAFGATTAGQVGQAVGKAAQGISQNAFDYAIKLQDLYNQNQAMDRGLNAAKVAGQEFSQWKENNTLQQAVTTLPAIQDKIQDIVQKGGEGLSPIAQRYYNEVVRRYTTSYLMDAASYSAQQGHMSLIDGPDKAADQAVNLYTANPNPATLDALTRTVAQSANIRFQSAGLTPDDPTVREYIRSKLSPAFFSVAKQMIDSGDITGAADFFDKHKPDMNEREITALAGALRSGSKDFVIQSAAQAIANGQAMTDTRGQMPTTGGGVARYNNPGNVTNLPGGRQWPGQTGTDGKFAIFDSEASGERAAESNLIARQTQHGLTTLNQIIGDPQYGWAPAADHNNPTAYAAAVGRAVGVDPNAPIDLVHNPALRQKVLDAIYTQEGELRSGHTVQPRTVAPPPPITPNEDPAQIKADYDTYIENSANTLFGDDPALAARVKDAARNAIAVKIQAVGQAQAAADHRLTNAIMSGAQNGTAPATEAELKKAYPGADADWALLPPQAQTEVGRQLNLAAAGYGGYKTPEMDANAEQLAGLRVSDPAKFADTTQTNISSMNLSAADKIKFLGLQASDARNLQHQDDTLKLYLSNPLVASIVKSNFPDRSTPAYQQFLGALQGGVERLYLKPGERPSQEQIQKIAQDLVTQRGGVFGIGGQPAYAVPPDIAAQINAKFKPAYGRDLSAAEIAQIYAANQP